MPRHYRCKMCGKTHGPPTGKHCREALHDGGETEPAVDNNADVLYLVRELTKRIDNMESACARSTEGSDIVSIPEEIWPIGSTGEMFPPATGSKTTGVTGHRGRDNVSVQHGRWVRDARSGLEAASVHMHSALRNDDERGERAGDSDSRPLPTQSTEVLSHYNDELR